MSDPSTAPDWLSYVANLLQLVRQGPAQPEHVTMAGEGPRPFNPALAPVLLFSPHPDDESITGLLPMRLLVEEGRTVVNIAVTLGSKKERRQARAEELKAGCAVLGFRCQHLRSLQEAPERLRNLVVDAGRASDPALVEEILSILCRHRPALVVYPHALDRHPTHLAVSRLLEFALLRYTAEDASVLAVETECWQPMQNSNLAVEGSPGHVAILCQAISRHLGEVARNPYHFRQPIRMMENFFRASELVGGFGQNSDRVSFAELYTLHAFENGDKKRWQRPISLAVNQSAGLLFGGG